MMIIRQSGVALITVMLILALATVTAVSMASRQNIDTHRSANTLNYEQAYQYILAGEDFSKQILIEHFANNLTTLVTQANIELWTVGVGFDIEGGAISGEINDLQSLFNINSLVDSTGVANQYQMTRFRNLLRNIPPISGSNRTINVNIVEAIVDWIDRDQNPLGVNGVEDDVYMGFEKPYRTANQTMSDISELLLINGIDQEIYNILLEYVCVLNNVDTNINVNTADALVISSLDSSITLIQATTLVNDRSSDGFASVAEFLNDPIFAGLNTNNIKTGLSVTSEYFRSRTSVQVGKANLRFISQLRRSASVNGNITFNVIKRSRGVI